MNLNLKLSMNEDEQAEQRIREAVTKKKNAGYQPTWEEIWITGYTSHTGTFKKGIFQTNISSARDKERLIAVKEAVENNELDIGVEDMKKFTKAHALRLWKQLNEIRREATIDKMLREKPDNYHTVHTESQLQNLKEMMEQEEEVAVDTETTGLDYFEDVIVGISFTLPKADYHCYIPVAHNNPMIRQLNREHVLETLRDLLESDELKKIYFNAKYDIHMFRRHGVKMGGFHFDGLIAMKLLNENETSYALKNLATKYGEFFGFVDKSATYEDLFGKGGFENTPIGIGSVYACKDTHLTYKFYKDFLMVHLERLPDIKKLYFEIERPITEVCIEMEQNGFKIDLEFAEQYAKELNEELDIISKKIELNFGDVNINSPLQLQKALYDEMSLPDVSKKRSTEKKVLKKLAKYNPAVNLILEYRDIKKLLSTYVEALPQRVKGDNRLHGQFNQADTVTGRFASKEPNLQNLPARARKLVVAPEGKIIVGIDFSQIEPRLLSHLSGDETMINAYVEGRDLYSEMAANVFKLDIKYCLDGQYDPTGTFQPRKVIKAVLLGIMYGMGSGTLSENIGVTKEYAEQIIDDFYITYPKVKAYIDARHQLAFEQEFISTMYGRKRRFPEHNKIAKQYLSLVKKAERKLGHKPKDFIWEEKGLTYREKAAIWEVGKKYHVVNRQSVNATIQGSAADVMKIAMIILYEYCLLMGYKMVATVHDEVLIEMPVDATREEITKLAEMMRTCIEVSVPMKVDPEVMERWGEGMDLDTWYDLRETGHVTRNVKGYEEFYNTENKMWEELAQ
ncbi:DNA polymerase [Priestia megaterium]|uniref:DNA polymerase n=1 Tax=Priestia megaterium TaxID=1404 RepID=UPI000BFA3BB4|nr:DNA polymerase [Priestia megaterium]PFW43819.1 DNA polymerase I [Priestia megaterium]